MRPIANFTLHAILAACLAAVAASSAAAAPERRSGKEAIYYTITLTNVAPQQQDKGQHLEVQSWHWGMPNDAPGVGGVSVGAGDINDSRSGHSMLGASDKITVGANRTESNPTSGRVTGLATDPAEPTAAQATGKRQHRPFAARGIYDQGAPPPSGSLTVLANAGSCNLGARYPSLTLAGEGKAYLLEDVRVAGCAASGPSEEITFVYGKVRVRGWNPEKKEE